MSVCISTYRSSPVPRPGILRHVPPAQFPDFAANENGKMITPRNLRSASHDQKECDFPGKREIL